MENTYFDATKAKADETSVLMKLDPKFLIDRWIKHSQQFGDSTTQWQAVAERIRYCKIARQRKMVCFSEHAIELKPVYAEILA